MASSQEGDPGAGHGRLEPFHHRGPRVPGVPRFLAEVAGFVAPVQEGRPPSPDREDQIRPAPVADDRQPFLHFRAGRQKHGLEQSAALEPARDQHRLAGGGVFAGRERRHLRDLAVQTSQEFPSGEGRLAVGGSVGDLHHLQKAKGADRRGRVRPLAADADEVRQPPDRGVRRAGQQRQQDAAAVLAQHVRFVGEFRGRVGRINAKDVAFGLQGAAELGGAGVGAAGDDHGLDGRVGEHFLHVVRRAVGRDFVAAGGDEGGGHRQAVGVVSQQRETHGLSLPNADFSYGPVHSAPAWETTSRCRGHGDRGRPNSDFFTERQRRIKPERMKDER